MKLPSKYSPKNTEDRIYDLWLKGFCFAARTNTHKRPFTIVIPPPNITGILHMGHALNNTIQDVLIRFKRMQGFEALWMPGTDHAGIATQNVVEKQLAKEGLRKEDIGKEEFIKRLWQWRNQYGSTIIEQLKKLGASCDWQRTRFTMDEGYSEAVKEVFVRLYEKGLIYRGNYIINWCPRCRTALSDEESPYSDIDGWLYYIKYPIDKPYKTNEGKVIEYIVVATTRPETMLGDTAVAINPTDERYKWLKERTVILPVMNRKLQVIEDELVDPQFGTGIVKVTPAHDPVDFILGKKYNLEFINIMNEDATLNEKAGDFCGMDRFEARKALLELLEEKGLIEKKEPYVVRAGHCYRCHTVIEPRLSLQWFVKMRPLAVNAIRVVENDKIKFYPSRWKKVYLNWMYNIQDWCISRQIWWGHRLPVYYCKSCMKNSEATEEEFIVSREKPSQCPKCGSKEIYQDENVLDTWFSSWLWPFATFYWPKETEDLAYFYPTDVLVTASEILFFWVARMIMASLEFIGKIPFHTVLIHGTVRDDKGIKMSKSLGNIIDPLDIIDKFGADALRFSLMMLASTGSDVYLNEEKFLVGRNFANKIWNAFRFILSRIDEEKLFIDDLDLNDVDDVDEWVLSELNKTIKDVTISFDSYRISDATKQIYEFFWHIFCDWYIEIVKSNLKASKAKVLIKCLVVSLKLLHPVMPFVTEEIYQILKGKFPSIFKGYIMSSKWPEPLEVKFNEADKEIIDFCVSLVKDIRNLKVDLGIPSKKKVAVVMKVSHKVKKSIERNRDWIIRLSDLEGVSFEDKLKRVIFNNEHVELDFSLSDFDTEAYIASLDKRIEKLKALLLGTERKLKNDNFIKKAPSSTVEKEKERHRTLSNDIMRLERLRKCFLS